MSIDAAPDCYLFSFIFAGLLLDSIFVLQSVWEGDLISFELLRRRE